MFLKDFSSRVDLEKVIKNERDLKVFQVMKKELYKIGFDVIALASLDRENTHCAVPCNMQNKFARYSELEKKYFKNIPILKLYIRTKDNYISLNIDEQLSRPNNESILISIKNIWKETIIKFKYDADKYYDNTFSKFPKILFNIKDI